MADRRTAPSGNLGQLREGRGVRRGHRLLATVAVPGAMTAGCSPSTSAGPREVEWEGKTVRTAIWKEPVDGPRMVRRINIDGDDQADRLAHGGEHRAVFVYQIESYRYWERELGRDDFTYGQFGENFTVEGLADDEVCIGDRYRIGDALFEVTQPRVTCYRVGHPDGRARRCRRCWSPTTGPGFYLRVLEEGAVQAGDDDRQGRRRARAADGRARSTRCSTCPNKSRALLERALRVPALSEGWKGSFRELLGQGRRRHAAAAPAWPGLPAAARRGRSAARARRHLVPARARRRRGPRARRAAPASTSPCACGRTPTRRR